MPINSKRLLTDKRSTSWTSLQCIQLVLATGSPLYRQFCINCIFPTELRNLHHIIASLSCVLQRLYFYQKYVFRKSRKGKGPTVANKGRKKRTKKGGGGETTTTTTTTTDTNEAANRSRDRSHDIKARLSKPIPHKILPFRGSI